MSAPPAVLGPLVLAAARDLLRNRVLLFFTFFGPLAYLTAFAVLFSSAGPGPLRASAPGLLGWTIACSGALGVAVSLAGWRRSGLLGQIRRSPAGWRPVLLARLLALCGHTAWQAAVHLAVAIALGLRPVRWWPLPLYLLAGTLAFAALGLVVGALTASADRAAAVTMLILIPMGVASGAFITEAPSWVHALAALLPMRQQRNGLLAALSETDPAGLWWPLPALLGVAAVLGAAGLWLCARRDRVLSP
ncbi:MULTISPECIES: ABC transporter permease [unclassified Crossiella]|uniref:ABC transporter permease n=1 Tax=unclassified Crossiella TaxID=2620835 RepID=UPI001FFE97E8|nr:MULTISPECIES: ABC transporter permease [unclassified Crossiella]MCK2244856.1 ABC transporter permease [Crossiella sp. S99.2]MCK2258591.1 ABC transporter permease [Crossiella sp. S99.1]